MMQEVRVTVSRAAYGSANPVVIVASDAGIAIGLGGYNYALSVSEAVLLADALLSVARLVAGQSHVRPDARTAA